MACGIAMGDFTTTQTEARAVTRQIGEHRVTSALLDDLVAAKEWAGRPKDREVVDELCSLRAEPYELRYAR